MKYYFQESELIENSNSLDMQDIFVLTMTNGMKNGSFLEIGCNHPINYNNTFILEKYFNWSGIAIDFYDDFRPSWVEHRPNSIFRAMDATRIDYESLIMSSYPGMTIIDYLQLDIEPSLNTLKALKRIPLNKYKFRTITYETDFYNEGDFARNESRKIFIEAGYELVVGDVYTHYYGGGHPYEDWWVHPDLVDRNIIELIKEKGQQNQDPRVFLSYD